MPRMTGVTRIGQYAIDKRREEDEAKRENGLGPSGKAYRVAYNLAELHLVGNTSEDRDIRDAFMDPAFIDCLLGMQDRVRGEPGKK